jgi:hypothetical protein
VGKACSRTARDPHVLFGQVEIVGVGVAERTLEARLVGQPEEEGAQGRQWGMNRRAAQAIAGSDADLGVQLPLEGNGVLGAELAEVAPGGRRLEAAQ